MKRIELFDDEVVLIAIFDYLLSKPSEQFNIESFPNLKLQTIHLICDKAISSESI